jgi:hypothetical protein
VQSPNFGLTRYAGVLGKTFIDTLTGIRNNHGFFAPLIIGNPNNGGLVVSKHELVTRIGVGNFAAARRVSRACEELGIHNLQEFLATPPEHFATLENFGVTSCYVVLRIREWQKHGVAWDADVTFSSLHQRELKEAEKEAKEKRARQKNFRSRKLAKAGISLAKTG